MYKNNLLSYLYWTQVNDNMLEIPKFSPTTKGALWDMWTSDRGVFITFDNERILTYLYCRESVQGMFINSIYITTTSYVLYSFNLYSMHILVTKYLLLSRFHDVGYCLKLL